MVGMLCIVSGLGAFGELRLFALIDGGDGPASGWCTCIHLINMLTFGASFLSSGLICVLLKLPSC